MTAPLPPLPVTRVGSLPRSPELLRALRARRRGDLDRAGFDAVADEAVRGALALQLAAGVDIVTDGEQRRDNFYSFVAEKLDGVRAMTLSEMLDHVEDKAGFERLLATLDVPAYAITNPTCVGRLSPREPLAVDELRFVRSHTDAPVKIPLPGPYILTRAMWVPELTGRVYASKEDLAEDVVAILRAEAEALAAAGASFIQFDEPVLSELVFGRGQTRTFMCAALAARSDPEEELAFAIDLINRVAADLPVRTGLHVCRGNWSRDESTLLSGGYAPLQPTFDALAVDQLVLEYATPRAGAIVPPGAKELGLGIVNPRTDEIETVQALAARIEAALEVVPIDRLFLNPDCGFGTFALRPMNDDARVDGKLRAMAAAARAVRDRLA
ncbi:MAG: cobalamin-independent methionine synthase II family protein [Anaerolineae bacterium]